MDALVDLGTAMSRFTELTDAAFGHEQVPTCPGWTSADLIAHLGGVHRWAAAVVLSAERISRPPQAPVTSPVSEWYAGIAAALLAALQAVDPEEPVPNFSRLDETAGFWTRRQLHETTIHTIDLSLALGLGLDAWPVAPEVAADGVDEVVSVFFGHLTARGRAPRLDGSVRLRATDVGRTWLIAPSSFAGGPPVVVHDHGREVAGEARGAAADLYRALWKRQDVGALELAGTAAALLAGPTTA